MPYKDKAKQKEYNKKYIRDHYVNNKEYYLKKSYINRKTTAARNKKFTNRYKKLCTCLHCGIDNPLVLQFHHVEGTKEFNISAKIYSLSLEKLKTEIRKCIILCANCHILEHARLSDLSG